MEVPRHWRIQQQRYSLVGRECAQCGSKSFPPPASGKCASCASTESRSFRFCGKGRIYSYSTVFHPPEGFEELAPYVVALVELDEGPIVAAQLSDIDGVELEIGMPVEMVTRKLREDGNRGIVVYGYKFRPRLH